jgi:glutamate-ammonia-ligase adenylyltransferase
LGQIVLNPDFPDEEAIRKITDSGVPEPLQVLEGIRLLQQAPAFPHSPTRLRNLMANLLPLLVSACRYLPDPRNLFIRLDRFADHLGSRAALYAEMVENSEFGDRIIRLLGSGEFLSESLIRYPELLDSVTRFPAILNDDLPSSLTRMLQSVQDDDSFRDAIRRFKKKETFKVGAAELTKPGEILYRKHLSELAELILGSTLERTFASFPELLDAPCCLIALGKLGGSELSYHSDLDIVFFLDDHRSGATPGTFEAVLKLFRDHLTAYTSEGRAYRLDFRLRPEGRHATEIVTKSRIKQYFHDRLEAWERLAYTKSRIVYKSRSFQTSDFLNRLIFSRKFDAKDKTTIRSIRERKEKEIGREKEREVFDPKTGRGSLLDIQFLVQYLQIQHQIIEPNTLNCLGILKRNSLVSEAEYSTLHTALLFLYSVESILSLTRTEEQIGIPLEGPSNRLIAEFLGFDSGDAFLDKYRETTEGVREVFDRHFDRD